MKYRIMIAGSRDFNDYEFLKTTVVKAIAKRDDVVKQCDSIVIVSGKARGADSLGEKFAEEFGLEVEEYKAEWNNLDLQPCKIKYNQYGKPYNCLAGFNRNLDMVKAADLVIMFSINNSPGTAHDLKLCLEHNKDYEFYSL